MPSEPPPTARGHRWRVVGDKAWRCPCGVQVAHDSLGVVYRAPGGEWVSYEPPHDTDVSDPHF